MTCPISCMVVAIVSVVCCALLSWERCPELEKNILRPSDTLSAFGDGLSAVSNLHGVKWIPKVSFLQLPFLQGCQVMESLQLLGSAGDVRARLDGCLG